MSVIDEIAAERQRQVDVEGWSTEHDDQHTTGALARAAACYAVGSMLDQALSTYGGVAFRSSLWPWDDGWWKPKDRRTNLIRAGALITAEIERLDRKAVSNAHSR